MSLLVLLKLVDIWATLEAGVGFKLCWSAHAVVPGCLLWSGFGLWGQVAWQQVTRRYLKASCVLQENERTKDMIIEQRFHRAIIGQKGEKIKEIRDKFPEASFLFYFYFFALAFEGRCACVWWWSKILAHSLQVIINFPDPAHKSDVVQLRGPRTEVEKCTKFMQKMVAEMVSNACFQLFDGGVRVDCKNIRVWMA